jgi:hypothetical protein
MRSKWPETHFRAEIQAFNREFLDLVCADGRPGMAFGLPVPVRQRLVLLAPAQRVAIADTPCLLAAFMLVPPWRGRQGVADAAASAPFREPVAPPQADAVRLFAAALLTWLWHIAREDRLVAALCVGPGTLGIQQLGSADLRDLHRVAAAATDCLEARFCRHPRFWPDLVRAASHADPQLLTATRLSAVQLTLVSRH